MGMLHSLAIALLLHPAGAFSVAWGAPPSPRHASARTSGAVASFAFSAGDFGRERKEKARAGLRDALMHRTVELQVNAYAIVRELVYKQYLTSQWQTYLDKHATIGQLTEFLDVLMRSPPTSLYMPGRHFRQLSPNNPYLQKQPPKDGTYSEIKPASVAMRLSNVREQLATSWQDQIEDFGGSLLRAFDGEVAGASLANSSTASRESFFCSEGERAGDEQLLRGMATKMAVREMLHDLSLRPSQAQVREWLTSYLLVQHAADLTRDGSVARLHTDLEEQPVFICGGALVDPMQINLELRARSADILEHMANDLRDAGSHVALPQTASFLNSCLDLQ